MQNSGLFIHHAEEDKLVTTVKATKHNLEPHVLDKDAGTWGSIGEIMRDSRF